jgi:hypothetical protein
MSGWLPGIQPLHLDDGTGQSRYRPAPAKDCFRGRLLGSPMTWLGRNRTVQGETSCVHVCPGSPQRALSDRKENGTANHAEHAKGGGALQGQDYASDLKARLAEVE